MPQPMEVNPEHLVTTASSLTTAHDAAHGSISATAPSISPVPAAADEVSRAAATSFGFKASAALGMLDDGMVKLLAGVDMLIPVARDYQRTDTTGGTGIGASADRL